MYVDLLEFSTSLQHVLNLCTCARLQRDKEDLVTDSGRATDQLSAISRQLADTVRRSALTVEELTESSRVVSETHEEFKGMGAVLGHSRY